MARKVLTGVKHVYITPWGEDGVTPSKANRLELTELIADTVAITQDDPETNSIDCETRDEPIIESTTLGKYNFEMNSADINHDILEKAMGFTKHGDMVAAPTSYVQKFVVLEVVMETDVLVVPRALLTSKIDASSLKTETVKGTISGSGYSCDVMPKEGDKFQTPFFVYDFAKNDMTADSYEGDFALAELNKGE